LKKKLIILLVVFAMIGAITGCGQSMKSCIAYFDTEIKKTLDASGLSYSYEVKESNFKESGYHFVDCSIWLKGNPTYKEVFNALDSIKSIEYPDNGIPLYKYWVNLDSCEIEYDYCLYYKGDYVYSPISEKNYSDLNKSEKKCICDWIQKQYDRYDAKEGKYSGDKYSDSIFMKAGDLFGLSQDELKVIWMKKYEYK